MRLSSCTQASGAGLTSFSLYEFEHDRSGLREPALGAANGVLDVRVDGFVFARRQAERVAVLVGIREVVDVRHQPETGSLASMSPMRLSAPAVMPW